MRNSLWPILAIILGATIAACGSDDDDGATGGTAGSATGGTAGSATGGSAGSTPQNGPGAFEADYETSSDFFTFMTEPVKGASPHGIVQIWYSSNIEDLENESTFTVPEGTVSIKEVYGDDVATLDGYAVMIKKEAGYDPDNHDWYYEMRDANGDVKDSPPPGKISSCISCHSAAKGKDFLAGWDVR